MSLELMDILNSVISSPTTDAGEQRCILTFDGSLICSDCCVRNYKTMLRATQTIPRIGWSVQDVIILDHLELTVQCDSCHEFLQ